MKHARTACDQEPPRHTVRFNLEHVESIKTYQTMVRIGFTPIQLRGEQTQPLEKHRYYLNCCRVITEETEVASEEAPEKNSGAPLSWTWSSAARGWGWVGAPLRSEKMVRTLLEATPAVRSRDNGANKSTFFCLLGYGDI